MELYDVVWFTQDHAQAGPALCRGVSPEECERRGISGFRIWQNVPMPSADGSASKGRLGNCICSNELGSTRLAPGQISHGRVPSWDRTCDHVEIEPGLVGANFAPEFLRSEEVVKTARDQERDEDAQVERRRLERERLASDVEAKASAAARRYFVACCHMIGIQHASDMPEQALTDCWAGARMSGATIKMPPIEEWVRAACPEAERLRARRPCRLDPGEFVRVAAAARMAAGVTTNVGRSS